ncbi:MAG: zinc-ribbon domain-containing protein [Spirochaetaceae bacterium]|jgi:hypothetical protein|nr:zinc-ribbon domain-containing protein [Spirochaetaceae bacterium]
MFCKNCGAEIAANAKFCSGCGATVNAQVAPQSATPVNASPLQAVPAQPEPAVPVVPQSAPPVYPIQPAPRQQINVPPQPAVPEKTAEASGERTSPNRQGSAIFQPAMPPQGQPGDSNKLAVLFFLVFLVLITMPGLMYWFWNVTYSSPSADVYGFFDLLQFVGYVFGIVACVRLKNVNRGIKIAALVLFAVNAVIQAYYFFLNFL